MENQNYSTPPLSPSPLSEIPKANNKTLVMALILVVAILLIAVGVMAGVYIFSNKTVSTTATTTEVTSVIPQAHNITWNDPQIIPTLNLIKSTAGYESVIKDTKYYKVGVINEGQYKSGEIVLVSTALFDGPSQYQSFVYFIKQGDKIVLLKNFTGPIDNSSLDSSKFTIDENYHIAQLDFPKTLAIPNGKVNLEIDPYVNALFVADNLKKVFTDPQLGDVYTTAIADPKNKDLFGRNGFYLKAPDGTVRVYSLKPDFIPAGQSPQITWSDGTKNETDYGYTDKTGCGSSNYASVASVSESDLKITGKTANGDDIFEFSDSSNKLLKDLYNNKYQVYGDTKKVSYQEFTANHPMFFWRDSFGRLIKFENSKYGPTAECGKPVIYLYPTKTEKVDVKVEPQGGLTYSDPAYKTGWSVIAKTNGDLTERSSGKSYPYLFWEGRGGIYEQPQKGFVVKQNDVHNFLVTKLSQFGLNTKETVDFLDFWEPKMQDSPYYFISFLGTLDMNRIAPLAITPKPDTVIRVLMDFSPLEKPIKVEGYNIITPERKGFTVIEWGGVLR